jgi:hypothetical protein
MKLTLLTPVLASILAMACVPALADTNAAPVATTTTASVSTKAVSTKPVPYKGTITAVDSSANMVTIKGAKSSMTLTVTPTTKFKGGTALADFAVGDKVTGSYTKDASGTMSAYSLHKKK